MKAVLLAALALCTLALAGCSGGGPVTPHVDAQGRYEIHLTSANRFSPANAQVPANATVVFNTDGGVHDVTAHDESWSSDDAVGGLGHKLQPGESYVHTFAAAGDVDYHCKLHASQGMKGTLHVGA
jgi:plastocyanin